jgi:pimeloyl-ACP methyl ester carboxylesterase
VTYRHPLAFLLGLEGAALLRAYAGDGFDREFVEARIAETRALLDAAPELGEGAELAGVTAADGAVVPAIYGQLNHPDPAWWDRVTEITAPTLIIGGGLDSHIPQDKLEETAARLPHGTLQVIPAGHHVHANRPVEFTAAVLGFLRA